MHLQVQNTCLDQTTRVLYKFSKLCCKQRIYGSSIGKKNLSQRAQLLMRRDDIIYMNTNVIRLSQRRDSVL